MIDVDGSVVLRGKMSEGEGRKVKELQPGATIGEAAIEGD